MVTALGLQGTEPGDRKSCTGSSGKEGRGHKQGVCVGGGGLGVVQRASCWALLLVSSQSTGGQGDEESKKTARFSTSGTKRMRVPFTCIQQIFRSPLCKALSDILRRRQMVNKQQISV